MKQISLYNHNAYTNLPLFTPKRKNLNFKAFSDNKDESRRFQVIKDLGVFFIDLYHMCDI